LSDRPWVGLISDTHGLLRSEAVERLRGAERIVHAGDVGRGPILEGLASVAPVTAVRGNVDHHGRPSSLPFFDVLEWNGAMIYVLHDIADLDLDPAAAGFAAVVYGHSHRPNLERKNGVLYVNPGSAGPRRFRLSPSIARLWREADGVRAEIVPL
jgi:putative phosphoesterase